MGSKTMTNTLPPTENWEEQYDDIFERYEETDCGTYGMSEEGHERLKDFIRNLLKEETKQARLGLLHEIISKLESNYFKERHSEGNNSPRIMEMVGVTNNFVKYLEALKSSLEEERL